MNTPSAHDMLIAALTTGGYHGLFNADTDCSCEVSDLMPCGAHPFGCCAGWRHPAAGDEIVIWDQPPVDPIAAGQQSLFEKTP